MTCTERHHLVYFTCNDIGLFCTTINAHNHTHTLLLQAESWINEKLQVANDESFRDPTNLENKLQKHQEFEAEVNANETQIQNIAEVTSVPTTSTIY